MNVGNPKHIAFLVSSFRMGGGEKQMIEIANELAAQGYKIDLLMLKPVGPLESHVGAGVRVISLDRRRMILSLFPLWKYLRLERPEALLSIDEFTSLLALMARPSSSPGTRVVLRVGNMLSELSGRYQGKSKLLPFFVRRLYKKADCVIANSQGVARDIEQVCRVPKERIRVIFNPKDLSEIRSLAAEPVDIDWLMENHQHPAVVWFGRLREQKNLPMLLRAFAAAQKQVESRLVIVGQGREQGRLEALAAELGVRERVLFAGYQDNPYKFLAKADIYAASSLWEGLPNALIEALVCAVPSIAADCDSGPREILAPDTDPFKRIKSGVEWAKYGALVPVNGEQELAEALSVLLKNKARRESYALLGTERSAAFDYRDIIGAYAQALGV